MKTERIANVFICGVALVGIILYVIGQQSKNPDVFLIGAGLYALFSLILFCRNANFRVRFATAIGGALKSGIAGILIAFFLFGFTVAVVWVLGLVCVPIALLTNVVGLIRGC